MMRIIRYAVPICFLFACGGGETYTPPAEHETPAEIAADQPAVVTADTPVEESQPATPPAARPSTQQRPAPPPPPPPATEELAPPPPPSGPEEPEARRDPAPLALARGTKLTLTTQAEITSRTTKAGDVMRASLTEALLDEEGRTVLPAGAVVTIRVLEIQPAENQGEQGRLTLRPESVALGGVSYPLRADVTTLQTELQGRGVTAGDAGKVAAGAAAGAILGRIIGKKSTGTVVGGVAGAAVGTAVAIKTADRDVVVPAGSVIGLTLTEEFSRPGS